VLLRPIEATEPSPWERLAILRVEVVPAPTLPEAFRRTAIASEVAYLVSSLQKQVSRDGLRYVRQTADGLIAVYADPEQGLDAARKLRKRKPGTGLRVRYGLFWGDAFVDAERSPAGGEGEMLRQMLSLTKKDLVVAAGENDLPDRDRVLMTSGTLAQLPERLRGDFVSLGHFRVPGFNGLLEIWTESLEAFLGRKPTNTERNFGVAGLHPETVLDVRWAQRFSNLDSSSRR
jgi:class 3 adenylate cyclase